MTAVDVVIPAHRKDFPVLRHCVRAALRHLTPIANVYVVAADAFGWPDERVRWIPEPASPLLPGLADIRARWGDEHAWRAGWIYQQLLKLGADRYIDGLSPSYLVIDSDVIFLRPVSFDPDAVGRFPYSRALEHHLPYRDAYERLLGEAPTAGCSLTAHHMLYDRELIAGLRSAVESRHGKPWHDAYIDAVDTGEPSSISEMDVYGWYVLEHHPEATTLRQLAWRDARVAPGIVGRTQLAADYDFVAAHAWAHQGRPERLRGTVARTCAELWAAARAPVRR